MKYRYYAPLVLAGWAVVLVACQSPKATRPESTPETTPAQWQAYEERSNQWLEQDRAVLAQELDSLGQDEATLPRRANRFGFDPDQPSAWYHSAEGQRIADILLSFQTPSGGWGKRTDMGTAPRQPGEAFGAEPNYAPTFDNDATTTQITVLAKAYKATGNPDYQSAYRRGIELLLTSQYPNGGWPQTFPLRGGYHDYITFNDEAMENTMTVLHRVSTGQPPFDTAPESLRARAADSLAQALDLVVAAQVVVDGEPTIWGGQHDPKNLEPRKARAYEMVSLATAESISLLNFMMDLPRPPDNVQRAVHAAMHWYQESQINGYRWDRDTREIVPDADAPPLWPRFAEIGTNHPLFGDRDHSIHYDIREISKERRDGYAWYTTAPNRVLEKYQDWKTRFPQR
ncbi:pectate lyase [Marinimicrobium sp. ARAG 43.8]|uniref:pectate lyase n=1 Tax=Marinimicrobium sp. ARAG 43.8 TaxID=3418719 RepID=UPI003CF89DE8